jgi:hypothetical protein
MSVEVRKVEVTHHETGVGVEDRTEVRHELGAEIDGTWVPFVTVDDNRVADFKARAEAAKSSGKSSSSAGK